MEGVCDLWWKTLRASKLFETLFSSLLQGYGSVYPLITVMRDPHQFHSKHINHIEHMEIKGIFLTCLLNFKE